MEAILKKQIIVNKTACRLIGVSVFVILTGLGAFVRIPLPFTPVPITLQTFFVLLSAAFLGSNLGAMSQLSYVFLGIAGLPIFTGAGSGLLYLLGPTGGYLFGFILSAFFIGRFIKYSRDNLFLAFGILCLGDLILLASGVIWLKILLGYSLTRLLFIGLIPFIPGDLFKALVASILYLKLKSRLQEIFSNETQTYGTS
jgi:biotin transport system substrate-specific component